MLDRVSEFRCMGSTQTTTDVACNLVSEGKQIDKLEFC